MTDTAGTEAHRVLIAGAGVAGLEALIALHQLAGEQVATTLLAPTDEFLIRALSVGSPFARPVPRTYDVRRVCADHGAQFRRDAVREVDPATHTVALAGGDELPYDSLLVAIGARPVVAFEDAITFRGLQDAEAMHGLIQDVEGGYSSRIAFVVPPGTTWPLPLYELALMTAERAADVGAPVQLVIVTPEAEPLAIFGSRASSGVADLLAARGIVLRTQCDVTAIAKGSVFAGQERAEVVAERVVCLPTLHGPHIAGLPADADGFLPVDDHGLVLETRDVYGAGDGTTNRVKQGGVAAQQGFAAAMSIAARAGVPVDPRPVRPVLRAELFTGGHSTFLHALASPGSAGRASTVSDEALWWPPTKVAAPHLAPYLARLDESGTGIAGRAPSS
jgi:sulfide:quinone oxidoreductase